MGARSGAAEQPYQSRYQYTPSWTSFEASSMYIHTIAQRRLQPYQIEDRTIHPPFKMGLSIFGFRKRLHSWKKPLPQLCIPALPMLLPVLLWRHCLAQPLDSRLVHHQARAVLVPCILLILGFYPAFNIAPHCVQRSPVQRGGSSITVSWWRAQS